MDNPKEDVDEASASSEGISLEKIQLLLRAKDDTQRFVGLALLKAVLDNSESLRQDPEAVKELWSNISPKFLDRLLRTGSKPQNANSKDMLSLAVSILHTFVVLLPDESKQKPSLAGRIPALVDSVLHRCALYIFSCLSLLIV